MSYDPEGSLLVGKLSWKELSLIAWPCGKRKDYKVAFLFLSWLSIWKEYHSMKSCWEPILTTFRNKIICFVFYSCSLVSRNLSQFPQWHFNSQKIRRRDLQLLVMVSCFRAVVGWHAGALTRGSGCHDWPQQMKAQLSTRTRHLVFLQSLMIFNLAQFFHTLY